jgi:diaminohydroxyphosphoribosylaminopyrimidine deaminase/5-amino-6-(5-phosphoribosylamino)uracil reductase
MTSQHPATSSAAPLRAMLARLGELEINEVLVEAGPTLTGALVQHGLADELLLYIAPKLLGPQARPLFELPPLVDLQQAQRFRMIEQRQIGEDLRLRLRPA